MARRQLFLSGKPQLRLLPLLVLITFGFIQARVAHAADIFVNTCTTSELVDAIDDANDETNFPGTDTIHLTNPCTYTLTSDLPDITSVIVINGFGAAIDGANNFRPFIIRTAGNLTLNNVTVRNGSANVLGGGISNLGGVVTLNGSTVSDNRLTLQSDGGGIYNDSGTVNLNNSTISGNLGDKGGGIYNDGFSAPAAILNIANSIISGNTAGIAGALPATGFGGGINNNFGTVNITNSTIAGNSAINGAGGGIENLNGTITITNSTIAGNTTGLGGGIDSFNGTINITNSTIAGNTAATGGGIQNAVGGVTVRNSIIASNPSGGDCSGSGITFTGPNLGCGGSVTGAAGLDAFNGTFYPLLPGSPAVDTGDNGVCPANDQSGAARFDGDGDLAVECDLGAIEAQFVSPVLSINAVTAAEGSGGTTTFTFSLNLNIAALAGGVTFDIAAADNTATAADADYVPISLTGQNIPAGGTGPYHFSVTVNGDSKFEPDESFFVNLTNVTGAFVPDAQGLGTITNDDTSGVVVNPASGLVTTEAGGTANFTVVLASQPIVDVTINLANRDTSEGSVPPSITFTNANWNLPQTVTITGVDDLIADGDTPYTIVTSIITADPVYSAIDPDDVGVVNQDNETSGISIAPTVVTASEGSNQSYQIQLTSVPSGTITIQISFDPAQVNINGSTSPISLTFTDTIPQTITLFVIQNVDDADRSTLIAHAIMSSAAPEYPVGLTLPTVTVQIDDLPPPPPTPLCEDHNFAEGGVVRASTRDGLDYAINCRILYQNGEPTQWLGGDLYNAGSIGIQSVLDLGVIQVVDIFSPVGRTYFEGGAVFCLRGEGTLIWMAARNAPRVPEVIGSYTVDDFPGFTCATLFEPGTLVLVRDNPL